MIYHTYGNIFTVVAPSGTGKSSLVRSVIKQDSQIILSVSYTTRTPRLGETHGKDYVFVSELEFNKIKNDNGFAEWAQVHGNFYGTPNNLIEDTIKTGQDIILEIDWQGSKQIKNCYPETVGIFILPPSLDILEDRLRIRGQDTLSSMKRRLACAKIEISHINEFDYFIINEDFVKASKDLLTIIHATRLQYKCKFHNKILSKISK